jgi:hypothetical protein
MFTTLLPSTGNVADHIENTSSFIRIFVLPSNELQHSPQRTQLPLLCVRWHVYTQSLPSSGSIRHNILHVYNFVDFHKNYCSNFCYDTFFYYIRNVGICLCDYTILETKRRMFQTLFIYLTKKYLVN